ncbi:MAG: hypothetical protein KatS3mg023_3895 [Armatimonadota bacterium]|nr:MAG: hypothetical protein KatS3mg023_3895 [Armatimonadota bacterium]
MAAVSSATVVSLTDKMTAWYLQVKSALGNGTSGASAKAVDLQNIVLALGDYQQVVALLQPSETVRNASLADVYAPGTMAIFLSALNNLCAQSGLNGVSDLNTFASYYNIGAGGAWNCLFAPDFRELYGLWSNGTYPNAHNTYFEVLQGGTYPNALRKLVIGSGQTAGYDIDDAKYAGGYAQLKWSGVSGSGNVNVSGLWRKTDGTTAVGNGTISVSTASGTGSITPPYAGALILSCSNINVPAGITAGTFYVEAVRPTGRSNPPT